MIFDFLLEKRVIFFLGRTFFLAISTEKVIFRVKKLEISKKKKLHMPGQICRKRRIRLEEFFFFVKKEGVASNYQPEECCPTDCCD